MFNHMPRANLGDHCNEYVIQMKTVTQINEIHMGKQSSNIFVIFMYKMCDMLFMSYISSCMHYVLVDSMWYFHVVFQTIWYAFLRMCIHT